MYESEEILWESMSKFMNLESDGGEDTDTIVCSLREKIEYHGDILIGRIRMRSSTHTQKLR